jgi:predicted O-methyltransferase YrrM
MRASATTLAPEISANELATLTSLLSREHLAGRHLEIGTAAGGTLAALMRCYPDGKRPSFVVVDPMTYFPDQLATVRRNLAASGLDPDKVDFRVGKSWPMFQRAALDGEAYSFVFIDGSHKLRYVTQDLAWTRLVDPGGIVCLHDYHPDFPGVVEAVDRFLARYSNYQVLRRTETLLVLRKTALSPNAEISWWDRVRAHVLGTVHQLAAGVAKHVRPGAARASS